MSPSFICICNRVSETEIVRAIVKKKKYSLKEIIPFTGAGASCGKCRPMVSTILLNTMQGIPNVQKSIDWND